MDTNINKKSSPKEIFTFISTIISWTIFVLLMICVVLLLYYFIFTKLYATKGDKYEPVFSLYTIISPSMYPNIEVYDVVINMRVDSPEQIKIGDVITFISESTESMGATVTHRVVSILKDEQGNYSYQTKGDNNLIEDSSSVPYSNVIGKVSLRVPQLGKVQAFVASSYGWLFLILMPALYIIFKDLIKLLRLKVGEEKFKKYKIFRALNRPLLSGNKPKLLPEPKLATLEPLITNVIVNKFVDEEDDEIDFDDLPKLK